MSVPLLGIFDFSNVHSWASLCLAYSKFKNMNVWRSLLAHTCRSILDVRGFHGVHARELGPSWMPRSDNPRVPGTELWLLTVSCASRFLLGASFLHVCLKSSSAQPREQVRLCTYLVGFRSNVWPCGRGVLVRDHELKGATFSCISEVSNLPIKSFMTHRTQNTLKSFLYPRECAPHQFVFDLLQEATATCKSELSGNLMCRKVSERPEDLLELFEILIVFQRFDGAY